MIRILVALALCLHLLLPFAVYAQDKVKDPSGYTLKTWGFILGMALLGGFVNWYGQVRRGELSVFSINHLVGELCTSAFTGLIAFFICEWANFPAMLTAALTGICGHMGTRAMSMFEGWAASKFGSIGGPSVDKTPD